MRPPRISRARTMRRRAWPKRAATPHQGIASADVLSASTLALLRDVLAAPLESAGQADRMAAAIMALVRRDRALVRRRRGGRSPE